ncbi:MAG: ABC transporter permease, partial [bacterium]
MRLLKIDEAGIVMALAALVAGLSFASPDFLAADNLLTVARQFSVYGIMAVGMTYVIVAGEIDLSVGSVLALTGCLAAKLVVEHGWALPLASSLAVATGAVVGALNGMLTVALGIPSFIITLGMMSVIRGLTYVMTSAMPIGGLPEEFRTLGYGTVGGVPLPVVLMGVVALAGGVGLSRSQFGRHVYATGGNLEAARLSGVPVHAVRIEVFAILGALAGLAGVLNAAWVTVAQPVAGLGYELDVIAAVIIGGASFAG